MSQGGSVLFPSTLLDYRPVPGSYFGIFVVSLLLAIVSRIGRQFQKGKEKRNWSQRFPVVGLKDLDSNDDLSRKYQGVFLFAFIGLPMLSLLHFNGKVLRHADVADRNTGSVYDNQPFYIADPKLVFSIGNYRNSFCMGQNLEPVQLCSKTDNYEGGITWFPLTSPIAMILVSIYSLTYALSYLFHIFRPYRKEE